MPDSVAGFERSQRDLISTAQWWSRRLLKSRESPGRQTEPCYTPFARGNPPDVGGTQCGVTKLGTPSGCLHLQTPVRKSHCDCSPCLQ